MEEIVLVRFSTAILFRVNGAAAAYPHYPFIP